MVLRFLFWRLIGLLAILLGLVVVLWLLEGGLGRALRGGEAVRYGDLSAALGAAAGRALALLAPLLTLAAVAGGALCLLGLLSCLLRLRARGRRRYVRLSADLYRLDTAEPADLATAYAALHATLSVLWLGRALRGQPSAALEVHHRPARAGGPARSWLAVCCPVGSELAVQSALRVAYPNLLLRRAADPVGSPPALLRLKKHATFIGRAATPERRARPGDPPVNDLLTAMGSLDAAAYVQMALTPAPALFERFARLLYRLREDHVSRRRHERLITLDRSMLLDAELRGGLEVQHRCLFFLDIRIVARSRRDCRRLAAILRARRGENRLVERGTALRHGLLGLYARRVQRGEGNPLPALLHGVFAPDELAELWQAPSVDYSAVPLARQPLPLAPAPPAIHRPDGPGLLRDALGPVSIHPELRRQNVAVPGTVEQGKSSLLVASVVEDLRRERCAVIVLDPKGDAADAALSAVPPERTCTFLDFAHPTCGFNPLAVDAPADVIADYVVAALKQLFTDSDIRASSDRYLRNAIIAVLSHDPAATLWDAARLLSVGEEGYAYRRRVAAGVRTLPELKEISQFFTDELSAQLADARSATTSKLDAPVNKLARLLNSPSIKRLLLNRSLLLDFDRVIAQAEVVIVKGALGALGAGNTAVLMQLLLGMLDAALARQQDGRAPDSRNAVALKIDEAPLVVNAGFAQTMALKRSAGLETLACWQADAQWVDREVRDQLDALFAHRIWFATASTRDARDGAALAMAEYSDTIRPDTARLSVLGRPDVRMRLPRHHAVASLTTPQGRQQAFIAQTLPMRIDPARIAHHAAAQARRGGRYLDSLDQPHWDRSPQPPPDPTPPNRADAPATPPEDRPGTSEPTARPARPAAESYRELAELDRASTLRKLPAGAIREIEPEPLDVEMLALIAEIGPVLSTQVHRRLGAGRALTTTQRRLKRLADARLVERFQLHRRDGGGAPMCYLIALRGRDLLEARGRPAPEPPEPFAALSAGRHEERALLERSRRCLRAAGWVLALADRSAPATLRGPLACVVPAPRLRDGVAMTPAHLRLPGGLVAHDLRRTVGPGRRVELDRFRTLRPDAGVSLPRADAPSLDVLVELDDRCQNDGWVAKLERYEHFLVGWSTKLTRYAPDGPARALVVFVCRDAARARACAARADDLLQACRAYPGEPPASWEYSARRAILFVAERDIHEGCARAWRVSPLPPAVRRRPHDTTADGLPAVEACKVPLGKVA